MWSDASDMIVFFTKKIRNQGSRQSQFRIFYEDQSRRPALKCENNLTDVRTAFKQPVRVGGIGQCKRSKNNRLHLTRLQPGPHVFLQVGSDRSLERHIPVAQCGRGDRQSLPENFRQTDLRFVAALKIDDPDNLPSAPRQPHRCSIAYTHHRSYPDHVRHAARFPSRSHLSSFFGLSVDAAFRAQPLACLHLVVRSCGRKYLATPGIHHLYRGNADPARSTMDEKGFARLESATIKNI